MKLNILCYPIKAKGMNCVTYLQVLKVLLSWGRLFALVDRANSSSQLPFKFYHFITTQAYILIKFFPNGNFLIYVEHEIYVKTLHQDCYAA